MLNYANPTQQYSAPRQKTESNGALISILAQLFVYRKSIIATILTTGFIAFGAGKLIPKRYVATAQLYLDPKGLQVFDNEISSSKNQDSTTGMNFVESQMRVILSQSVLRRVVEKEKLIEDEEFIKKASVSIIPSLGSLFSVKKEKVEPNYISQATNELYSKIQIKRAERTFIIDVTAKANDADKAALIANSIVQTYLEVQNDNRADNSRKTSTFLTSRLDELREKVRISEDLTESFRVKNNLLGAKGSLVNEQQLSDANFQLSAAKARYSDAQSRYDQIVRAKKIGDISGITEAINSPVIGSLRGQQSDASRKLSELSLELGSKHPQVLNARAQMNDLTRIINEELNRIAEATKNDLERAKATEDSANTALEKIKVQSATGNQANVQLRELEREVEANRQLYNAFLVRSRETGELEKLDTSNTRVITHATAPFTPTFPPRGSLLLFVGLVLGTILGFGQALLRAFFRKLTHV